MQIDLSSITLKVDALKHVLLAVYLQEVWQEDTDVFQGSWKRNAFAWRRQRDGLRKEMIGLRTPNYSTRKDIITIKWFVDWHRLLPLSKSLAWWLKIFAASLLISIWKLVGCIKANLYLLSTHAIPKQYMYAYNLYSMFVIELDLGYHILPRIWCQNRLRGPAVSRSENLRLSHRNRALAFKKLKSVVVIVTILKWSNYGRDISLISITQCM